MLYDDGNIACDEEALLIQALLPVGRQADSLRRH
jgi:hypothetical protein